MKAVDLEVPDKEGHQTSAACEARGPSRWLLGWHCFRSSQRIAQAKPGHCTAVDVICAHVWVCSAFDSADISVQVQYPKFALAAPRTTQDPQGEASVFQTSKQCATLKQIQWLQAASRITPPIILTIASSNPRPRNPHRDNLPRTELLLDGFTRRIVSCELSMILGSLGCGCDVLVSHVLLSGLWVLRRGALFRVCRL